MEIRPTGCPGCTGDHALPTTDYRVVLWEQPDFDGVPSDVIGWGEAAFDLTDVTDVHEVIRWAENQLASGAGCHSRAGQTVRDREYVVYARVQVPGENILVQIAGWDPSRSPKGANLARLKRHS